jgi:PAS domain S-box-containing protein
MEKKNAELLAVATKEIAFQNKERENRASELAIAYKELAFQNKEKESRAAELVIANRELAFENGEKKSRATELMIANKELAFQNEEKKNRAAELAIANKELAFQNEEKKSRAAELALANKELAFQNEEKKNRAAELVTANVELALQRVGETNRAAELVIANKELAFQNKEKENRAAELAIANTELVFQNNEKESRAAELVIANNELVFQNGEKESRAAELLIANVELAFQNGEKENRAAELLIANIELAFQNEEKENRAAELIIANKELVIQNEEKEKRAEDLAVLTVELNVQQEELRQANDELNEKTYLLIKQEEKVRVINQDLVLLNQELEERVVNRTRALAESETQFRNMMETIPQIAWTNTYAGDVTFYNQRWYDYTGLSSEQTRTWGWRKTIHPEDLQYTLDQFRAIRKTSDGGEFQIRVKSADGSYRWHLSRLMPINNEDHQNMLWVGTATDIHELRLLQQQKDDFISIASHELKTPITTLKASLQLLNRMKDNPTHAMLPSLIGQANKSLNKVTVLIEDLLNATQVNEGQIQLNKTSFTIAELIDDCCSYIRLEGIYTIVTKGDPLLKIYADADRMNQVIINFVNNAVKYAPDSKIIEVNIEKAGDMARVSVTDKGPGITDDKLNHLFDRYYRVQTHGIQGSGLGLGLYICAEIIKKHDGEIGVTSQLGKGSTFWFTLPL